MILKPSSIRSRLAKRLRGRHDPLPPLDEVLIRLLIPKQVAFSADRQLR